MTDAAIEVVNAIIDSAHIKIERGFLLDSWIFVKYESGGQGFGGFVLGGIGDEKVPASRHAEQPNLAAEWLVSVLRAAGVEKWSEVPGKVIRVRRDHEGFGGRILGIGHAIKDDCWFMPEQRIAQLQREQIDHAETLERSGL